MDNSPLGRLPPELRNHIAELSLTHDGYLWVDELHKTNGLTRTCRQMRTETHLLFLRSNTLVDDSDDNSMCAWLNALGAEAIGSIHRLEHCGAYFLEILPAGPRMQASELELPQDDHWAKESLLELYAKLGIVVRVAPGEEEEEDTYRTNRWVLFPPAEEDAKAAAL